MIPPSDNTDVISYIVFKHSWKPKKYRRIFSIGTKGVATYNDSTLEVTNSWSYADVISIRAVPPASDQNLLLIVKVRDRQNTMTFSTPYRLNLISDMLRQMRLFSERTLGTEKCEARKHHWSEIELPILLEVTPYSIDQLDIATSQLLGSYCFKDIAAIQEIEDKPDAFVIISAPFGRMHLFSCENKEIIFKRAKEWSIEYLCLQLNFPTEKIKYEDFFERRLGTFSSDEHVTSLSEFSVNKVDTPRHPEGQRRLLCLSETCLIERDPQTYNIVTLRPLCSIFALIREPTDPQLFTIEYVSGSFRTYSAVQRDSLLATLLDGVRASGNLNVHVKMCFTPRDKRLIPMNVLPEEELESMHLKFLYNPPPGREYSEIISRFNAVVPYSGLLYTVTQERMFSENKEKLITQAIKAIIAREGSNNDVTFIDLEAQFQALRRIIASRVGFQSFTMLQEFREKLGKKVSRAIKYENEAINHAAIDMVCALMQPMHSNYDIYREQLNKSSILSTHSFLESLLDMWVGYIRQNMGTLVVTAMLDLLTFALCIPYSETTKSEDFDALLEMVAVRGRYLFQLFQHSSLTVVKAAGLVMRAIIEEGDLEVAQRMQQLALSEGALLKHLITALFTRDENKRFLTHRQLSRHLVGLWVTNNPTAMDLLSRIMPRGLLNFLESDETVPDANECDLLNNRDNLKLAQDHAVRTQRNPRLVAIERKLRNLEREIDAALAHWGASLGLEKRNREEEMRERQVVLRKRRERLKSTANWKLFYWKFNQDHALPSLIWNHKTREELKELLEKELRAFTTDREVTGNSLIAWNHAEFEIKYNCLQEEVCIDGYYLRLLLESEGGFNIKNPFSFFNDLYHRFLVNSKQEMRYLCLQAMAVVYTQHYDQIGPFEDIKYLISLLEKSTDYGERDRLILLLSKLILVKENVKKIIDVNGIVILVDLLTLAHLHMSRAVAPTQTNAVEAGQNMSKDNNKEWHYAIGDEKYGPVTFSELCDLHAKGVITHRSQCWAPGLDTWHMLYQVPQLKWTVIARGRPMFNESELASLILSVLIRMCQYYPSRDENGAVIWPIPRIKRILSDHQYLRHVVQLLLTFDPVLVEKVAILLCDVAANNPASTKFYMTGVFFFILMYTGSNVLPVARFLQLTHATQAFRSENAQSCELMQRSILGPLLPEAMVYYLENHGAEKFAQIFLGEYDTPEAIWNAEMRRMVVEKISVHISDFTPRLRGNNRAQYQYARIPDIVYPQLENELFCNIYYLRHLCDTTRFPDWPISDPVKLLRDVLEAWKEEVEKKPPEMSLDDAYECLGLERGVYYEQKIVRQSYHKLAARYHPDKNPHGDDMFRKIHKAYEFVCTYSSTNAGGPNPDNIVLILRTQSILFHRCSNVLRPYKYAGYKQLIKTIQETSDEKLQSESLTLLSAATELAYHTVNCSALNAEELNREHGFSCLLGAYSRCVSVLNKSSKPSDISVQVCSHCTRCFCVAAQFTACRKTFVEMPQLIVDLIRILHFKHLSRLCCDVVACIISFSKDAYLQKSLIEHGAIWHLLLFLFKYDHTLEDCGVERSEDANKQEVLNRLAKLSVKACAALGGYIEDGENATPINDTARMIFSRLLTPYVVSQFIEENPHALLKTLTSNCETPYLIWNNSTRAELIDFLEKKCSERLLTEDGVVVAQVDLNFSSHSEELVIGGIFIRVYNLQPAYKIQEPVNFLLALLQYIESHSYTDQEKQAAKNVMALQALNNLILNNPGLEKYCINHFRMLFSLLNGRQRQEVQKHALQVIFIVTRNHECINSIASIDVLAYLFLSLYCLPSEQTVILDILTALSTSQSTVKDVLAKGEYIYLLDLLCNSSSRDVRLKTAELLSRLLNDKLSGPRLRLHIGKFLPYAVCETLRDEPCSALHLLDTNNENPELIWNDKARNKVYSTIRKNRNWLLENQCRNPSDMYKIPDNGLVLSEATDEVIVGGVYLKLFNRTPGWAVRRAKEFLTELLDATLNSMNRDPCEYLELYTMSVVRLLEAQPTLRDCVPSLGHIPKLCSQLLSNSNQKVSYSVITILHQLSQSDACVNDLSRTECLNPIKQAMKNHHKIVGIASETLSRMFTSRKDPLVKQALDVKLVPFLLSLLDGPLDGTENGGRIKAQIVKTLKDMTLSLSYGNDVTSILDKSSIWSAYRDQNHDLFLTNNATLPYLTSGPPISSGYLTQRSGRVMTNLPPPMSKDY